MSLLKCWRAGLPRLASAVLSFAILTNIAHAQTVSLEAPGASSDVVERLEQTSLLLRGPEEGETRTGQDVLAAARADYGRLIGILYEEGFFAPTITIRLDGRDAARISPFNAPAQVASAQILIDTGPTFTLGRAEIGPLANGTQVPSGFQTGQTATTPLLRETTRAALDGWRAQGYATADVASQQITAQNRAAILDVAIQIAPGRVITFGNLLPEGQERMRRARILEIAGLPTGEVYSPEALARAEERLRDTGVFSAVALTLRDPRGNDIADVTAVLDEAPLRRLGFGAEISTDEGARLSTFWIHRNLFGGAERLRFDAEISGIGQGSDDPDISVSAQFDRPATFGPDTALSALVEAERLDDPTFRSTGITTEIGLTHILTPEITLQGGLGLSFARVEDAFGERDVSLISLPFGATYDGRDDPLDARSGFYADAELRPFVTLNGGDVAFRFSFDGRGYVGFGEDDQTRLAGRVQLGSLSGGEIADIPPDDLFFSGGSGTVRGQSFQSLGALQDGRQSGGRGFLGVSGEVRHDIGDTAFGIVGFADAAFISEGAFGAGTSDFHAGAGVGARYDTPFGPIRIDLATPVSGDDAGQELFLYIGIGQAF